jgi:hypothetical protein
MECAIQEILGASSGADTTRKTLWIGGGEQGGVVAAAVHRPMFCGRRAKLARVCQDAALEEGVELVFDEARQLRSGAGLGVRDEALVAQTRLQRRLEVTR